MAISSLPSLMPMVILSGQQRLTEQVMGLASLFLAMRMTVIVKVDSKNKELWRCPLTSASSTNYDVFIAKLSSDGSFEWANSFGSSSHDVGVDVVILMMAVPS